MAKTEPTPRSQAEFQLAKEELLHRLASVDQEAQAITHGGDLAQYYAAMATLAGRRYTVLISLKKLYADFGQYWREGSPTSVHVSSEVIQRKPIDEPERPTQPLDKDALLAQMREMEAKLAAKQAGVVHTPPPTRPGHERDAYAIVYRKDEPGVSEQRWRGAGAIVARWGRRVADGVMPLGQYYGFIHFMVSKDVSLEQMARTVRESEDAFPGTVLTFDRPRDWSADYVESLRATVGA